MRFQTGIHRQERSMDAHLDTRIHRQPYTELEPGDVQRRRSSIMSSFQVLALLEESQLTAAVFKFPLDFGE